MSGIKLQPASSASELSFRICLRCRRAVPSDSVEYYCINDGSRLLGGCPQCGAGISSPYALFCASCGAALTDDQSTSLSS